MCVCLRVTGQYMIKTLEEGEAQLLLDILPFYKEHMEQNPDSLLVKFLGYVVTGLMMMGVMFGNGSNKSKRHYAWHAPTHRLSFFLLFVVVGFISLNCFFVSLQYFT